MSATSHVSRLIPLIYDAAEDPALWKIVLNEIGRLLKAVGNVFTIDDLRHGKSNMTAAAGIDPAFHRLYNERYESLNLHLQRARPLLTPGRVLGSHQLCSDQEAMASEYYHDFLRPQEDRWFHLVGGCVAKDRSLLSVLSFMRGRRAGHFSDREMRLLESFMPHLRRAARLHQVFSLNESVTACLDLLVTAAVLADEHGHVQFANNAAREILQGNDGIGIDRRGCLTSSDERFREAISAAFRSVVGMDISASNSILVQRPSGKRGYVVLVSPIRQCDPFSGERRPGAAVFISDPEMRGEPINEVIGRLYDMTSAEARIASLLVEGKDVNEICAELGIRRTTVRTHLASIRDKLGVKRQAEIVSVILKTARSLPPRLEGR